MPGRVLVVTLDRLPAWIMPAYGATWVSMGGLDALAARGVVCDRLIAPTADPVANAAALVAAAAAAAGPAGLLVTDAAGIAAAAPGIRTRLVEPRTGVDPADTEEWTSLGRLCDALREELLANAHRFLWCHAASLGITWDAPQAFRERYVDPADPPPPAGALVPDVAVTPATDPDLLLGIRQAYAGQLTLLDRRLSAALAAAEGWTVVFAGVRGLGLGLHGRAGPGPLPAYGELVHLPLILVDGAGRMAAQRYGGLVIPADVGVTLPQLLCGEDGAADILPHAPWQGRSLTRLFTDFVLPERDRVVAAVADGAAVVTPGWHAVAEPERGLRVFAKPDDFFELCDVADRCGLVADELARPLNAVAAGTPESGWLEPLAADAVAPAR